MKIKQLTIHKEYKLGLPQYSNCTVGITETFDIQEDEKIDWDVLWDEINRQLQIQASGLDQTWLRSDETKHFHKITIKTPKT